MLEILPLVDGGISSQVIDDSTISLSKTWSSSKINTELGTKASIEYVDEQIEALSGTANSDIEGKQTEDFTFVQSLPVSGEENQLVVIRGDNTDSLYKYVSGEWVEQTPDANKLYFDVENEALYSYVTAQHQFAPVSLVNTIVVGSNLNSNADLKALKTPGVYSVVQRLHNATKGDYIKNWTLYVESVDYEEYDKSDSVYQRLVSNYTIQKRTWSATRASNDGWSSFSTYYAGEIKDSTTSKYYTWSSNKLNASLGEKADKSELADYATIANVDSSLALKADKTYVDASLALKQNTLTAGDNISIENDTILALTASNSEIDLLFKTPVPLNEIWYTSLDGNIINVERIAFTSDIVSNTYNNGKGIVKFADNVYTVGAWAYKNKTNLTSIELPEVTGRIGGDCFIGCTNLTSIVIPATLKTITKNAFSGCTHLTSISFTGTISQWNSISKGSGWKTNVPATVVHCSDGDVNI